MRIYPSYKFYTDTISPSATANTFGTAIVWTPNDSDSLSDGPAMIPLHLGISTQGVSAETVTVRCQGQFSDGTFTGSSSNYTTSTGDVDPQNLMYGLVGTVNGNTGQRIADRKLLSITMDCKSTATSSGANVIIRLWLLQLRVGNNVSPT